MIEGVRSYAVGSQLPPVLVTETESRKPPGHDCFSNGGVPVRTAAVEKTGVRVIIVQDPDASHTVAVLGQRQWDARPVAALDADTFQRILWPLTRRFAVAQQPTTMLFEGTVDMAAPGRGLLCLMRSYDDRSRFAERRRFAGAVAAAVSAVRDGQRRAVVLVLSDQQDASQYDPQTVRRYLMAVGVPLFVWSVEPRPHLAALRGEMGDISTISKLLEATQRLRRKLGTQRVAWVATDPLTALRLEVKSECALAPVARWTP